MSEENNNIEGDEQELNPEEKKENPFLDPEEGVEKSPEMEEASDEPESPEGGAEQKLPSEKKKNSWLFVPWFVLFVILIPLLIAGLYMSARALQTSFYTEHVKKQDVLGLSLRAVMEFNDVQLEKDIAKIGDVEQAKTTMSNLSLTLDQAKERYEALYQAEREKTLVTEINGLKDMRFDDQDTYDNRRDFRDWKDQQIEIYENDLQQLENTRDEHEDAIDNAEKQVEILEESLAAMRKNYLRQLEDVNDLIASREGNRVDNILHDLEILSPQFELYFKKAFISQQVEPLIKNLEDYIFSYFQLSEKGYFFRQNGRSVLLEPEFKLGLQITTSNYQNAHLFSEVLVDIINENEDQLKEARLLRESFELLDSRLLDRMSRSVLKNFQMKYTRGTLIKEEVLIDDSRVLDRMNLLRLAALSRYVPWVCLGLLIIFTLQLWALAGNWRTLLRSTAWIYFIGSFLPLLVSLVVFILLKSQPALLLFPLMETRWAVLLGPALTVFVQDFFTLYWIAGGALTLVSLGLLFGVKSAKKAVV